MNKLVKLLAPWDGKRLNTAAIGRLLGVSAPTAAARVHALQRKGLVRLLPFFGGGRRFLVAAVVRGLPTGEFLKEIDDWILYRRTAREALEALHRTNGEATLGDTFEKTADSTEKDRCG